MTRRGSSGRSTRGIEMADQGKEPSRDAAGKLIGGVTARAPGIEQGDNLAGVVGGEAMDAEGTAVGLTRGEGSDGGAGGVAPVTASGASPGDKALRGVGAGGAGADLGETD